MKRIQTKQAVGHVLCHDMTQIIPGVSKDARFRKGHVVTEEDIPVLLSMGKEELYVWEKEKGMLHENEAAEIVYDICAGEHMKSSPVKEGKITVIADADGLLRIDVERLRALNSLGEIVIATRHDFFPVKKGDHLAGTRVVPLLISEEKMNWAKEVAGTSPVLSLYPYHHKKIGIVTTGNEVYQKRIEDAFTPVIIRKLQEFDTEIIGHVIRPDDHEQITAAILDMIAKGADMVVCTGGMSVDPDDKTPLAIKNTGADIVSYGAPVLPGAMFLLSYYQTTIPIVGLPGCVMYAKRTIFDLVLPRLMADYPVRSAELAALGLGGLCLSCDTCIFPNCGFGAGV